MARIPLMFGGCSKDERTRHSWLALTSHSHPKQGNPTTYNHLQVRTGPQRTCNMRPIASACLKGDTFHLSQLKHKASSPPLTAHFLLYCVHTSHFCYKTSTYFTESCSSHVCTEHRCIKASCSFLWCGLCFNLPRSWSQDCSCHGALGKILFGYPNAPCPDEDYSGLIHGLFNTQKFKSLQMQRQSTALECA